MKKVFYIISLIGYYYLVSFFGFLGSYLILSFLFASIPIFIKQKKIRKAYIFKNPVFYTVIFFVNYFLINNITLYNLLLVFSISCFYSSLAIEIYSYLFNKKKKKNDNIIVFDKAEKKKIALETISKLWQDKENVYEIKLEEIAEAVGQVEKEAETVIYEYKTKLARDFWEKYCVSVMDIAVRNVIAEVLNYLDTYNEISSVVSLKEYPKDIEAQTDTYKLLRNITLLEHSINVAEIMVDEIDSQSLMKGVLILTGLAHDLGKIAPYFNKNMLYSIGDHPKLSTMLLKEIPYFTTLKNAAEIDRAILKHHLTPDNNLGVILQKADKAARTKRELPKINRMLKEQEQKSADNKTPENNNTDTKDKSNKPDRPEEENNKNSQTEDKQQEVKNQQMQEQEKKQDIKDKQEPAKPDNTNKPKQEENKDSDNQKSADKSKADNENKKSKDSENKTKEAKANNKDKKVEDNKEQNNQKSNKQQKTQEQVKGQVKGIDLSKTIKKEKTEDNKEKKQEQANKPKVNINPLKAVKEENRKKKVERKVESTIKKQTKKNEAVQSELAFDTDNKILKVIGVKDILDKIEDEVNKGHLYFGFYQKFRVISVKRGIIYVHPESISKFVKELLKEKTGETSEICQSWEFEHVRKETFQELIKIMRKNNYLDKALIKEGYFSAPFWLVFRKEAGLPPLRMMYIPILANIFNTSIGEFEARKKDKLIYIEDVLPDYKNIVEELKERFPQMQIDNKNKGDSLWD